jgi:archaellum biogenesis ATPase FlaH
MTTKECLQCKQPFELTRSDKRFCNSTCRSNYYNSKKKQETQAMQQLTGLITSKGNKIAKAPPDESEINELNTEKKRYTNQLNLLKTAKQNNRLEHSKLANQLLMPNTYIGPILGSIAGAAITDKPIGVITGFIAGEIFTALSMQNINPNREEYIRQRLIQLDIENRRLDGKIHDAYVKLNSVQLKQSRRKHTAALLPGNDKKPAAINPIKNTGSNIHKSKNVVNSGDLVKMDYDQFDFKGKWLVFIGNPAINFFTAIHGKAGEGKSTFAIQFANYLATNFGKVLYVSGEEGFSKTFKDKFERLGATAQNLYVGDLKALKDIETELKKNAYHFIFIDSLDTLKIGPDEMKKLRQMFPEKAFITISQSTKDGKMRGSYEIIHDSDIVIQVADGKATTTKNRFLERDRVFEVF